MPTIDFATGFEGRATAQITNGFIEQGQFGSQGPGLIDTATPRSGARCWINNDTFGSNAFRRFMPQRSRRIVATAWRPTSISSQIICYVLDASGASAVGQVAVGMTGLGNLTIIRGNGSDLIPQTTTLATSAAAITAANVYHHIEMDATIANSAATVNVYLNQDPTPFVTYTGDTQASANAYSDGVGWVGGFQSRFDDLYSADDRLSFTDQKILPIYCSAGNGALTGSTPLSGTDRGAMVDETTPDDDTSYNIFDASEIDSYLHTTPGTTSTIRFLALWGRARKSNYGPVGVKIGLRLGAGPTNHLGTERFLTSGYTNFHEFYNISPESGVAFTEAELIAGEFLAQRST